MTKQNISDKPNHLGIYKKPLEYTAIHILCGFISCFFPVFGILFVVYQLFQLAISRRFFIFQLKIKKGNSFFHTTIKLFEFSFGVLVGLIIKLSYKNPKVSSPVYVT